jgi:hypothetical protein
MRFRLFEVAHNMGASVQMIQEYYRKQATSAVFATRLGDSPCLKLANNRRQTEENTILVAFAPTT